MLRLLGFIQRRIGDAEPWALLLDVAPTHVSAEFTAQAKEQFPQLQLVYTQAGTTSICQPCDTSDIRAFKSCIRRRFAECFAEQVLEGASEIGVLFKTPSLKGMLPHLCSAALEEVNTEEHRKVAWKHLIPDDMGALLQEAQMLQEYGALLREETRKKKKRRRQRKSFGMMMVSRPQIQKAVIMMTQQTSQTPEAPQAEAQEVISKSAARLLALRVVHGAHPPTAAEARARSAHMRWPMQGQSLRSEVLTNKLFQSLGGLWVCSPTSPCALPR